MATSSAVAASAFVVTLAAGISIARPAVAGRSGEGAGDAPAVVTYRDDLQRSYRTDKYL